MKKLPLFACLLTLFLSTSLYAFSDAYACDPDLPVTIQIMESDLPECAELHTYGISQTVKAWDGRLPIQNQCDLPLEFVAIDCDHCDDYLAIESGEEGELLLDGGSHLTDGYTSEQTFSWNLGEDQGTLQTSFRFRDTSGACDDWEDRNDSRFACNHSSNSAPSGDMALLGLILLLLVFGSHHRRINRNRLDVPGR